MIQSIELSAWYIYVKTQQQEVFFSRTCKIDITSMCTQSNSVFWSRFEYKMENTRKYIYFKWEERATMMMMATKLGWNIIWSGGRRENARIWLEEKVRSILSDIKFYLIQENPFHVLWNMINFLVISLPMLSSARSPSWESDDVLSNEKWCHLIASSTLRLFFNIDNDSHLFQRLWWWCWWWWWKYGRKILYGRFSLPSSQIFQRVNLENFLSPSFSTSLQSCLHFVRIIDFFLSILFLFSLNFLHYLIYVFFSFSEMKVFFPSSLNPTRPEVTDSFFEWLNGVAVQDPIDKYILVAMKEKTGNVGLCVI